MVEKFSNDYYEARHGHVTVSLSIGSGGSAEVFYSSRGSANHACKVAHHGRSGGRCPVDVSEADRYKYPACG